MSGQIIHILSWVCLVLGSIFTFIGCLGLLRLPDVFSRMHGGALAETLGIFLLFMGMAIQAFVILPTTEAAIPVVVKLALIMVFLFFTNPTTTHALAQAALWGGIDPATGKEQEKGEDL
jgi:multicomponent Na+:H+ antiporter subunit G